MKTALAIALGGALGSMARYGTGVLLQRALGSRWPWGTFAVNVLGSFLIGVAMALFASRGLEDSRLRLALTVGLLGGFTTYSAFAFETVGYLERRELGLAALYVGATLTLGALACAGGLLLVRGLGSSP